MAGARQSASLASEPLEDARVLVVEARYYDDLADELLKGALGVLKDAGVIATVVTVPGSLEIPSTVAIMLEAASAHGTPFDAVVTLGTVIRGETYHSKSWRAKAHARSWIFQLLMVCLLATVF